jgi:hypothetical protein
VPPTVDGSRSSGFVNATEMRAINTMRDMKFTPPEAPWTAAAGAHALRRNVIGVQAANKRALPRIVLSFA